ncbi:hypothetical protein [Chryseobacterium turcicum]|uniref:Uncharacterized protein n=1 Tax=Chryseobacterium turcicum TaxID=2898076 RepID=A0A9Q3YWZ8_9FLAO|nr:hypothetical protein [Chryseobacterium turcicum]MCD1118454.1 hypothetical protein [Chryseobacterium turcicum]
MKNLIILFALLIPFISYAQNKKLNSETRTKQLKLQNQENALDFKRLQKELSEKDSINKGPFTYGIFPYPDYDSISKKTFSGIGTTGNFYGINLNGKKIVYTSFSENKNSLNNYRVKENNRIFFTIVVLTDFIDEKNFKSMKSQIVSRNFPDVIGQGYIKTKENKIDFSAFVTLENDEFAIINMKLYNLKYGNIILIAPQKEGSLRSIQILADENLTTENIKMNVEKLLKNQQIKSFFTNENVI